MSAPKSQPRTAEKLVRKDRGGSNSSNFHLRHHRQTYNYLTLRLSTNLQSAFTINLPSLKIKNRIQHLVLRLLPHQRLDGSIQTSQPSHELRFFASQPFRLPPQNSKTSQPQTCSPAPSAQPPVASSRPAPDHQPSQQAGQHPAASPLPHPSPSAATMSVCSTTTPSRATSDRWTRTPTTSALDSWAPRPAAT